jgi:ABC-type glycerol-3-phosphate transport system substrate-binding protein
MINSRLIVWTVLAALLTGALVFILVPRSVSVENVTQAEVEWAYQILRDSLEDDRYMYRDFLAYHAPILESGLNSERQNIYAAAFPDEPLPGRRETAAYTVYAPSAGLYELSLEYNILSRSFMSLTVSVTVNGQTQYAEANNIDLPVFWRDETKDFPLDKFGDETVPRQIALEGWQTAGLFNNTYISGTPLLFFLEQGENIIGITNETSQTPMLGALTARPHAPPPAYAEYLAAHAGARVVDTLIDINSIDYIFKNSSYVQLESTSDAGARPTDPVFKKINMLYMQYPGNEVFYGVEVGESGFYKIALHCRIANDDFSNFIGLRINGSPPFKEAASYPLTPHSNTRWHNQVFSDSNGEPYLIYLSEGTHVISLRMELEPVSQALRDLRLLADHINQFSLDIIKITGREVDRNRTWRLTRYIPETEDFLAAYDIIVRSIMFSLTEYSPKGIRSSVMSDMAEALALLETMRRRPDELPLHLENLSGTTVSVLRLASGAMDRLYQQSIVINSIYLFGYGPGSTLPKENAGIFERLAAGAAQVWASYTSPKYTVRNRDDALNVWVNLSVFDVDIMQKLADTRFTPYSGIEVNFSVVPVAPGQPNRLVLSSAAGTNPDMALGIESYIPFDLAARGALYDLTRFPDFWQVASRKVPGAFVSYIYNEGVYAMPESVNFAATVYREDVFRQLNLEPPDTWDDVRAMMSELQRFNMSFYHPIASGDGYKWFFQTAPLIYQNNGLLYRPDGLGTAITEPNAVRGITELGELFTIYALAEQVPVFFNSFRFGQTPVGIIDAPGYILLRRAAPELTGQWGLAPYPGTRQEDGSVSRWFIANGRGGIIFENTNKPDECWEFLKWWTSEETQTEFAFIMQANYGALWLSSNMDALRNAPVDDGFIELMMGSIHWLRDVPRSPGQYMLERSLSDIWNTIVFDGTPPQVAVDLHAIEIQREFRRKMTEFGLVDAYGSPLAGYAVRELDWVLERIENYGAN